MTAAERTALALALALVLVLAMAPPALAAPSERCAELLTEAETWFREGQYQRLAGSDSLTACRDSAEERSTALRLLAIAHLEIAGTKKGGERQAEEERARELVGDLMEVDPRFEPDPEDPKRFRRLVERAKGAACSALLQNVDRWYRQGRFDDIQSAGLESDCLARKGWSVRHRLDRRERITAFRLLALTHLVLDQDEKALGLVRDLLQTSPDYEPELLDPPRFQALVAEIRSRRGDISSVSKTSESLWEAPATVVVVTREQIERRGYLDLEAVMHDLPGFDISRGNGQVYSNLYQRGFRANASDRILFLVDGVEQNDLHSSSAFLSRQYPLSNIDRIEVVYGPASTIYGANAYTGVINVITRKPADLLEEGERYGAIVQLAGGDLGTGLLDATVAGESGQVSWSLTGRVFRSDEQDLSGFPDWDYTDDTFAFLDYATRLGLTGERAAAFDDDTCGDLCVPIKQGDVTVAVELTPEGARRAAEFDRQGYAGVLNGRPIGFSDDTQDTFVSGRLEISDFVIGFQHWRREEGTTPWFTDQRGGKDNGSVWIPRNLSVFAGYDRSLGRSLKVAISARYLQHDLAPGSGVAVFNGYNGALTLEGLVQGQPSFWRRQELDQISSQMRTELRFVYSPADRLELVGGFEARNSSIQGDYLVVEEEVSGELLFAEPFQPRERLTFTDLGFYAQAAARWSDFRIILGGRIDYDDVREERVSASANVASADFGTVFNPRLAVVWAPEPSERRGALVLKAIYAEAFKQPSSFERFTTAPDRLLTNPGLKPEKVRNLELAAAWKNPAEGLSAGFSVYRSEYNSVVALAPQTVELRSFPGTPDAPVTIPTSRFDNLGAFQVLGAQANAAWEVEERDHERRWKAFANYTYTDPKTRRGGLRVPDIASHQFNLGVNLNLRERLDANLRMNWVGDRDTGEGTTAFENPLNQIDAYTVLNAALGYHIPGKGRFPNSTLQVIANNLLDEMYYHPGVQTSGGGFAARIPQPGRTVFVRLSSKIRLW